MAQEGRGKRSPSPDSMFEIDELDTNWDANEPSGVELMREPSLMPEPGSEVQAASQPPTIEGASREEPLSEIGLEEGLPLILPDSVEQVAAPPPWRPEPVRAVRRTGPVDPLRRTGPVHPVRNAAQTNPRVTESGAEDQDQSARTTSPGDPLLIEVRDRYAMGDYSGALIIAEGILANDPQNAQARRYADNCRQVLEQMYCAKLGPLNQRPEVGVSADQLRWLSLDHRAGFLLSLIDGSSTVEELLDISGMPRFEALRTLCDLLEQNVITLAR